MVPRSVISRQLANPFLVPDFSAAEHVNGRARRLAGWDDDLFSYGKETWFAQRETPSNCQLNLIDIVTNGLP